MSQPTQGKPKTGQTRRKQAKREHSNQKQPNRDQVQQSPSGEGERINRYLAHCGLCSRREADTWVLAGRVSINGEVIRQPGVRVSAEDDVRVDGKPVSQDQTQVYILYNKPKGLLCSRKDHKNRPLIYEKLDVPANVQSIGRLDMDSEGLLLLSNDGNLAYQLTHPSFQIPRQYRVRIAGQLSMESLAKLQNGGIDMGNNEMSVPWQVTVDSESRGHCWLTVTLKQGRWREIRRTLEAIDHPVRRLMRIRFGPIRLDENMPAGAWRELNSKELRSLKNLVK